jgi:polar amino acid transport system substrate-binding protein
MMSMNQTSRRVMALLAVLALAGVMAAVACGGGTSSKDKTATAAAKGGGTPAAGTAPAATKPAAAKIDITGVDELKDGTLDIGSDIAYAPIEFLDEKTNQPVGLDVDLANAMADALGVKAKFNNGAFDGLLPALDAKRYDAIMTAMTASASRKQTVDFVEYFNAGSGIIVSKNNPKAIKTADDLCGKKVAVQEGTTQVDFIIGTVDAPGGQDKKCKDAGKGGIEMLKFPTDPDAVQALVAGQADAEMADFPVAAYSAQQSAGKLEVVPNQIEPAPYGIALRKTSKPLNEALTKAFAEIKKNGKYDEILKKWNLEAGKLN